jgi:hypothetical protein
MTKKLDKKLILDLINQGLPVQVACTYSNVCRWQYLTTKGNVTCEEFGYIEDLIEDTDLTWPLPAMTWASVKRLQKVLINLQNN